jgi:hypothetical protein
LPQALQKCTARMVPHDQQVEVASPGTISELVFGFDAAIKTFTTAADFMSRRGGSELLG